MAGESILVIDDSPTLLRIVARTLGRAGYRVRTAEGGARGVTMAKQERPDVILLDYLMPGLDGEEVCRALGQDAALRDVPVVVMSSRGHKLGAKLVEKLGVVDYLAKPFAPDALVAITGDTVHRYVREGTPSPRLSLASAPAGSMVTARPAEPTAHADHLTRVRNRLHEVLAAALAEAFSAMPEGAVADADARAAAIEHALGAAFPEPVISELGRLCVVAVPECALADEHVLRADMSRVAVADLLQLFRIQRQTGVLVASSGNERIEAYFRDGRVDWVGGRNMREEFLLGRFIVETHAMSHQDLELFLRSRSGTRKLLGAQLVKLGYITPEDLASSLAQQASEIIYELMRWRTGHCEFRHRATLPAHVADAHLDLPLEHVLMEGFRRLDAWQQIESVIHSFDIVFARNEEAIVTFGLDHLEPTELVVLEQVDGHQRVRDILEKTRLGSFVVCQLLHRLLEHSLVRKRVEPAPPQRL